MSSVTLRKASTDDSDFAYSVKEVKRSRVQAVQERVSGSDEDELFRCKAGVGVVLSLFSVNRGRGWVHSGDPI
jgi:hypothetical protein